MPKWLANRLTILALHSELGGQGGALAVPLASTASATNVVLWLAYGLLANPHELIYYVSRNPKGFTSLINQFTCLKGKTKGGGVCERTTQYG